MSHAQTPAKADGPVRGMVRALPSNNWASNVSHACLQLTQPSSFMASPAFQIFVIARIFPLANCIT